MRARSAAALAVSLFFILGTGAARAQSDCSRVVVFTLPGVTWSDVRRNAPEEILRASEEGAIGSMSVRTNSARTTYASGFATIGAGTRVDGGRTTGGPVDPAGTEPLFREDVEIAGLGEMADLAERAGYEAIPGALAEALPDVRVLAIGNAESSVPPPIIGGYERWPLLAAMDAGGVVDLAATGPGLIVERGDGTAETSPLIVDAVRRGLGPTCGVSVIDHGDLIRAEQGTLAGIEDVDEARAVALERADGLLGIVRASLDPARDLLLIVSPTSPLEEPAAHFGVAIGVGPRFPPGSELTSARTRRPGMVTLLDVAPTILLHQDAERPPSMLGRPITARETDTDRIASAIELDRESTFVDRVRAPVFTAFVALELLVYGLIAFHLWRRRTTRAPNVPLLEAAALALLSVPVSTFLIGGISGHRLGVVGYFALLIAIDAAITTIVWRSVRHRLDRVGAVVALTSFVLLADLVTGSRLQLNTVFSYSPIVAGRFTGIGNIGFAILGTAVILTAALLVRRLGRTALALGIAGLLFIATVVIDGAPPFGSDVGGTLALVPSLGLTWLLLWGRRPSWRTVGVVGLAAIVIAGGFLVWDLSLPEESRTHLGRFYEDVTERGGEVFLETITRKIRANLRVFTSTIWTYLVPPLLIFVGWLLLRPEGRWKDVTARYPAVRAGVLGGLILSVLGFAVNDSGIVVPAMVLSMLVPTALIVHLMLDSDVRA